MSMQLDLDDVAGTSELAKRQLAGLRSDFTRSVNGYKAEIAAYKRAARCDALTIEAWKNDALRYKADADSLAIENATMRHALIGSTRWMEEWNERWRFLDAKARLEFCFEMNRLINQARSTLAAHERGEG